jgi:hypothetical protein
LTITESARQEADNTKVRYKNDYCSFSTLDLALVTEVVEIYAYLNADVCQSGNSCIFVQMSITG